MLADKLTQHETTQKESVCEELVWWGLSWLVTEVGGPCLNAGGAVPGSGPWLCTGESRCLSRDGNQGWLYSLCDLDWECGVTSSLSSLALTPSKWWTVTWDCKPNLHPLCYFWSSCFINATMASPYICMYIYIYFFFPEIRSCFVALAGAHYISQAGLEPIDTCFPLTLQCWD